MGSNRGGSKTQVELETTDELLEMYDYAIGIKTGVTNLAGPSFMGAAEKDGAELYAIVLGSTDEMQRFRDAMTMFEWGFEHVRELKLANSETTTNMNAAGISGDVPVVAEVSHGDWIDKTVKATLANPDASITVYDLEGNVTQSVELDDLHGTVRAGQKVGQIVFLQRNVEIARQDLLACETVDAPNPIESLSISWDRFTGGFGGKPERPPRQLRNRRADEHRLRRCGDRRCVLRVRHAARAWVPASLPAAYEGRARRSFCVQRRIRAREDREGEPVAG